MLALFQGIFGHNKMVEPVGSNVNEVDILAFAELFVAFFAAVDVSGRHAGVAKIFVAGFGALAFVVAECLNFGTIDVCPAENGTRATHAKADKGHSYGLHLRCREAQSRLLAGRPLRNFGNDCTVFYLIRPVKRNFLAHNGQDCAEEQAHVNKEFLHD